MKNNAQSVWRLFLLLSYFSIYTLAFSLCARAQNTREVGADTFASSATATNQWLASTNGLKFFAVLAQNSSSSDVWLLAFNRATNGINNGAVSDLAPVKVLAGTTGGWDFGLPGFPCRTGLVVCVSTTDRALTNGSAVAQMTVTFRKPTH